MSSSSSVGVGHRASEDNDEDDLSVPSDTAYDDAEIAATASVIRIIGNSGQLSSSSSDMDE